MAKDIAAQAKQGLFWTALFNSINFVVRFGSSIVLARVLDPVHFGLMGIGMIVVQLGRRIANFGFSLALVQKKDIDQTHYDTVFIVNTAFMSAVAVGLVLLADWIGVNVFNDERVGPVLQVIALDFVLKAFLAVPRAKLSREMRFRELETGRSVGMFITLLLPVPLALMGYGVWSLVYGNLVGTFFNVIITSWYGGYFGGFKYRYQSLKDVFSFGAWAFVNNAFNYFINKVDYTLIGIFLNATMLGFYERAFNLMSLPRKRISKNVNHVLFSTFSRIQDDDERIVRGLLQATSYIGFLVYPLMVWMYFAAPSMIVILYGEKWVDTVVPLQIMCVSGLVNVLTMLFQPILKAKALLKQYAQVQVVYFAVLTASIYYGLTWGIVGVAWGVAFSSVVFFLLIFLLIRRHLPLSFTRFMLAQKSILVYSSVQVAALIALKLFAEPIFGEFSVEMLASTSAISAITIIGMHLLLRFEDVDTAFQDVLKQVARMGSKVPALQRFKFFTPPKKKKKKRKKGGKQQEADISKESPNEDNRISSEGEGN